MGGNDAAVKGRSGRAWAVLAAAIIVIVAVLIGIGAGITISYYKKAIEKFSLLWHTKYKKTMKGRYCYVRNSQDSGAGGG